MVDKAAPLIVITGASGHIGHVLGQRLLDAGMQVRAIGRGPEKLSSLMAAGAEARFGDVRDATFLSDAFRGAAAVFAMTPPFYDAPDFAAAMRTAAASLAQALTAAAVPRVVALSGLTPNTQVDPIAALHDFDQRLQSMPMIGVVAIKPAFFMENLLPSMHGIKRAGRMSGASRGDLATPMVATRDIAAVAAELLLDLNFTHYTSRELRSARNYTFSEAAAILGAAVGNPAVPYVQCGYDEYRNIFTRAGMSPSAADFHVELARVFNEVPASLTGDGAIIAPTTLEQFAADTFAPAFSKL